jgi:hypothetical protein
MKRSSSISSTRNNSISSSPSSSQKSSTPYFSFSSNSSIRRRYRCSKILPSEPSSDDEFEFKDEEEEEMEEVAEEEDKEVENIFNWTTTQPSFDISLSLCHREEKIKEHASHCTYPLTLLQLFLTPVMMRKFVNYTNEYADFFCGNKLINETAINSDDKNNRWKPEDEENIERYDDFSSSSSGSADERTLPKQRKHMAEWEVTTEAELWIFFSIQIMMGLVKISRTEDYWRKEFKLPLITDNMTRDRFRYLLRFFRVAPLSETNPHILNNNNNIISHNSFTPLPHVNSLIIQLNENFGRYLSPGPQLAYDESMVDFQGYSIIRQYMKGKPHPWGYKILCLVYNRYVISFEVYGGKRKETDPLPSELGTTGDAVVRLMEKAKVVGFNHIVFLDSWFNSPLLVKKLNDLGIKTCGSVNSKRLYLPKCPLVELDGKQKEDHNSPLSK